MAANAGDLDLGKPALWAGTRRRGDILGTPVLGRLSVAVGATAWEHAQYEDGVLLGVEAQQNAPVADAQAPLVTALQLDDIAGWWAGNQAVERVVDPSADRRVDAAQVAIAPEA